MSMPSRAHGLQPYYSLIDDALSTRNACNGDFETDREHGVPVFVSRLCAKLAETCVARSQAPVTIKDVLRLDAMASGHIDYHSKLARYCLELEKRGNAGSQIQERT